MAQRYFVDELPEPGSFELTGDLAHHLRTVLRSKPGQEIRLADGRGGTARAGIVAVDRRAVTLQVAPSERQPAPARRLHLAVSPPRKTRADWLFEHGTEVGVSVFWPIWTRRTRPQGEKPDRWERLVRAAAGQCNRAWLPVVQPVSELEDFLARRDLPEQRYIADRDGELPPAVAPVLTGSGPATSKPRDRGDVLLLVGPEGGFAAEERETALAAGFTPLRLGNHVLRTETAALVGAALLGLDLDRHTGAGAPDDS